MELRAALSRTPNCGVELLQRRDQDSPLRERPAQLLRIYVGLFGSAHRANCAARPTRLEGFSGRLVDWAASQLRMRVEIVRELIEQRGFAVHPKRWFVERSLAWLTAHRRLARDYERDPAVSEAFIRWAIIRRPARDGPAKHQIRGLPNSPG